MSMNISKIDWNLLPSWTKYISMNSDNIWYAYNMKPSIFIETWEIEFYYMFNMFRVWGTELQHNDMDMSDVKYYKIPDDISNSWNFYEDWKDTLIKKPSDIDYTSAHKDNMDELLVKLNTIQEEIDTLKQTCVHPLDSVNMKKIDDPTSPYDIWICCSKCHTQWFKRESEFFIKQLWD